MTTFKAITFEQHGDVNVLNYSELQKTSPGSAQVLVKNKSIGVNYIDLYHRDGSHPAPVTGILGVEAAGTVEEVGSEVTDLSVGDRVVYLGFGTYGEYTIVDRKSIAKVPDFVSLDTAAAIYAQGVTALTLVKGTYKIKKGDVAVVHAAAGGTGQQIIKLAKHLGATVIGITSSDEKAKIAFEVGSDHVINYRTEDIAKRVLEITNGQGADVIYDSIGKSTFESSLESVKKFGTFISFGKASGEVEPFNINKLTAKNTMFTSSTAYNYIGTQEEVAFWAEDLFNLYKEGAVHENIHKIYPLSEAKQAQIDLAGGNTTGKLLLVV